MSCVAEPRNETPGSVRKLHIVAGVSTHDKIGGKWRAGFYSTESAGLGINWSVGGVHSRYNNGLPSPMSDFVVVKRKTPAMPCLVGGLLLAVIREKI
jgi:hypothetical protein